MRSFKDLKLSDKLIAILQDMGYSTPTPIQRLSAGHILNGSDILGIAKTGSGKTAAFSLPIIEKQIRNPDQKQAVLVLEPTRELTQQTAKMIEEYTKFFPIQVFTVHGTNANLPPSRTLRKTAHFIVATPSAIYGLIEKDQKLVGDITHLVLDEADKLLQPSYSEMINKILYFMPQKHQTILYTSTINIPIERKAKKYLHHQYKKITAEKGKNKFSQPSETISQYLQYIDKKEKFSLLCEILNSLKPASTIIFLRTQARAEKVYKKLLKENYKASLIHGGKEQRIRDIAKGNFSSRQTNIMVTTDLAARGLDFEELSLVINFDLPNSEETYVHRIGRTGRANHSGTAISFAEPEERVRMENIQKLIRQRIPLYKSTNHENIVPPIQHMAPNKEKALKHQEHRRLQREAARTIHKKRPDKKSKHSLEEYKEYKKQKRIQKRQKETLDNSSPK